MPLGRQAHVRNLGRDLGRPWLKFTKSASKLTSDSARVGKSAKLVF